MENKNLAKKFLATQDMSLFCEIFNAAGTGITANDLRRSGVTALDIENALNKMKPKTLEKFKKRLESYQSFTLRIIKSGTVEILAKDLSEAATKCQEVKDWGVQWNEKTIALGK